MDIRPRRPAGDDARRQRRPYGALHLSAPADVGRGRPLLVDTAAPGKEVEGEQVNGGAAAVLSPQGQGGADGLHRFPRFHAGPQEILHQFPRLGALPLGPGPGAHAVAQEDIQHPVGPLEIGARVSADCLPLPGGPGQGDGGPKWLRLGKEQASVSHLPLPQGRAQDLFQLPPSRPGGQLAGGGGLHPQPALPVVVHCPAGLVHAF